MPKTYKTEIIGYRFDELTKEVKEKLYEKDYETFSYYDNLDPIEEEFRSHLVKHFGADPETLEVYYDLSYSQGSGACCVGELDVATVFENHVGSYFTKLLSLVDSHKVKIDNISIVRCGPSNFYSHENTCQVEIEFTNDPTKVDGWDIVEAEELEQMLTNAIREELCDFHSKLQDYYEEITSFEAYCDYMTNDANNVYKEDGEVIDPSFIRNAFVIDAVQLKLEFDDYNFT